MNLDVQFQYQVTLDQKEFSVVTRSLAGHVLKDHDLPVARELNKRMLQIRVAQIKDYLKSSERALEVANQESEQQ